MWYLTPLSELNSLLQIRHRYFPASKSPCRHRETGRQGDRTTGRQDNRTTGRQVRIGWSGPNKKAQKPRLCCAFYNNNRKKKHFKCRVSKSPLVQELYSNNLNCHAVTAEQNWRCVRGRAYPAAEPQVSLEPGHTGVHTVTALEDTDRKSVV